jgi:hypothetical protein
MEWDSPVFMRVSHFGFAMERSKSNPQLGTRLGTATWRYRTAPLILLLLRFFQAEEVKVAAGVAKIMSLRTSESAQQYAALSQVNVARTSPVSRSHSFTVLSAAAETARCPSGVTATALTQSEWPASVCSPRCLVTRNYGLHHWSCRSGRASSAASACSLARARYRNRLHHSRC